MRQRLTIITCLCAWFLATGCQWDVAQWVAWGRMFAGYSQKMSLAAAAEKTLSGEMCELCKVVQKGREAQDAAAPVANTPGKGGIKAPDVVPFRDVIHLVSPSREVVGIVADPASSTSRGRMAPPLPPPRRVA